MSSQRVILGIDPGSRVTGFGVIEARGSEVKAKSFGIIKLNAEESYGQRLLELGENMEELLLQYKPTDVVIESIFLGKNADSAFKLGHARGVVWHLSLRAGCEVYEYATRLIKQGITGSGGASKIEVQNWLQKYLKIPSIEPLDASDALALAVFHAHRHQSIQRKLLHTRAERNP